MAKKVIIICLLVLPLALLLGMGRGVVRAQTDEPAFSIDTMEIDYANSPVNKFGRGVINTATCWAEVPAEIARVSKDSDPVLGWTLGLAQGTINTIIRGAVGIYDTLTCVVPPYNKPEMQPEYALASADEAFRAYLW